MPAVLDTTYVFDDPVLHADAMTRQHIDTGHVGAKPWPPVRTSSCNTWLGKTSAMRAMGVPGSRKTREASKRRVGVRQGAAWTGLWLLVALGCFLPRAHAQYGDFSDTKVRLKYEPKVSETMKAALRYFRVDPANFDRLRRTASTRAWLPTFAAGYRMDDTTTAQEDIGLAGGSVQGLNTDSLSRTNTVSIGAVWDLRELVFNPAEVQVYGLIGVQRDLMLETTRIYYLRRQLFVRFLNNPPRDPLASEALTLRVEEFTALLDVLTGGWFSEQTDMAMRRAGIEASGSKEPKESGKPSISSRPRQTTNYRLRSVPPPSARKRNGPGNRGPGNNGAGSGLGASTGKGSAPGQASSPAIRSKPIAR